MSRSRSDIAATAIDTNAEVGYAGASFARIAEKLGISRGLISYHAGEIAAVFDRATRIEGRQ
jgi:AcrR family transcriptional regulator